MLYSIAERYQNSPKPDYAKAASLYQKIIADYPSTAYAARAKVFSGAIKVLTAIDLGQDINLELAKFKTAYAGNPMLHAAMMTIGEKSYEKGFSKLSQEADPNNSLFKFSAALLENDVVPNAPDNTARAMAHYMVGLNYEQLGEYAKAAGAFGAAYQADPKYLYADYCLFAQGRCYEKLKASGKIDANEADVLIKNAYQTFLAEYPDHSMADYVVLRLAEINHGAP